MSENSYLDRMVVRWPAILSIFVSMVADFFGGDPPIYVVLELPLITEPKEIYSFSSFLE